MRDFGKSCRIPAILLCMAALFSACMKVGPDYVRPGTAVSTNWLGAGDERVATAPAEYRTWWKAFNDPVLDGIIDRAYRENLSLKIAGVRVLEARAQLGIAVGNLYPQTQQASGSVTYNRFSEASPALASIPTTGASSFQFSYWQDQVNLNAAWEIDFWGKFRRAVESADASLTQAVADYDSALVTLTADAANFYVQIRTLEKRLDIARQNVDTQKESLRIAEARLRDGTATERDVEQAKTSLFNTQSTIPTLRTQLRQAKNALCVLLAMPPAELPDMIEGTSNIPAPPPQVAVGIPADLLRRRPDIRSAEMQAAAQCAQIGVAKADLLPAFSLTGSFGFISSNIGRFSLADIADWRARTGSIGPSFQWNILSYGRIVDNVRVQDARFQQLLIAYQNTVLKAQQEVEDSLEAFLRAQENAEFLARSADSAQHSLELARIQYEQGSADFTSVITAQQALLTAQDSFAAALGSISGNLVALYRALGGGWQIREGHELVSPEIKEVMARRTNWGQLLAPAATVPASAAPRSTIRPPDL